MTVISSEKNELIKDNKYASVNRALIEKDPGLVHDYNTLNQDGKKGSDAFRVAFEDQTKTERNEEGEHSANLDVAKQHELTDRINAKDFATELKIL